MFCPAIPVEHDRASAKKANAIRSGRSSDRSLTNFLTIGGIQPTWCTASLCRGRERRRKCGSDRKRASCYSSLVPSRSRRSAMCRRARTAPGTCPDDPLNAFPRRGAASGFLRVHSLPNTTVANRRHQPPSIRHPKHPSHRRHCMKTSVLRDSTGRRRVVNDTSAVRQVLVKEYHLRCDPDTGRVRALRTTHRTLLVPNRDLVRWAKRGYIIWFAPAYERFGRTGFSHIDSA